ncbi:MAG: dihydrolipoyl dehydrogenase [Dehalococcoidia bacterium]
MDSFDVAVIGGGWGGYTAAVRCRQHGLSVALVEQDKLGGTCLHRGCIPTKVLLQSAENLDLARRLGEFGIQAGEPSLDFSVVSRRKEQIVEQLYTGLQRLVRTSDATVFAGTGRLDGPGRVQVSAASDAQTQTLQAQNVVVATGSRPKALPGVPTDGRWIIDSDQALALDHVPESIVILGAGAVGTEFASFYHDAGARVTLVELLPSVLPLEDQDISALLGRLFTKRGIRVMTGTGAVLDSIRTVEGGVELDVTTADKREHLQAECLLVATGREPLSAGIGLEAAGVKLERGFVVVDGQLRTSAPGIYAAGDVVGTLLLAHVAAAQGILAADTIAGKVTAEVNFARLPRATYCRPQVASVGLSEAEAKEQGRNVRTGRAHLRVNGKALIVGEPDGIVKVVADADSDDLLGLHLIGAGVTEMVAEGALAKFLDASLWELAASVYPHPTLSEAIGEAARAATRPPVRL